MKKREQGILSIEASIVLTLMLLCILFLFSFARVYRAQNLVGHATLQSADAVALESYLRETVLQSDASEVVDLVSYITESSAVSEESFESLRSADLPRVVREKFISAIAANEADADQKLRNMGVKGGLSGIDFSGCRMDLGNDDVIVSIRYTLELQYPIFGFKELEITKAAKAKTFGDILFAITTEAKEPGWGVTTGDAEVVHGTTVTITATPNYGYKFLGWDDDGDGDVDNTEAIRTVTANEAHHYIALFARDSFGVNLETKITYNKTYAAIEHKNYGTVEGAGVYTYQDTATITAKAAANYVFVGWDDNGDGKVDSTTASRTLKVEQIYHITAIFKPKTMTVKVKANDSSYGDVRVSQGNQKGTSITVEYGSRVTIVATPKTNYLFEKWDNNNTNASVSVVVQENKTYTANFAAAVYTVTFMDGSKVVAKVQVARGCSIDGSAHLNPKPKMPNDLAAKGTNAFDYWVRKDTQSRFTSATIVNKDLVVSARWLQLSIEITGGKTGSSGTTFTAKVPAVSGGSITWRSSNTAIATVNYGSVSAKKPGTVTITARFEYKGAVVEDSVTVTVGETTYTLGYCMNMATNGRRYYTKEHITLKKGKKEWGVEFKGTNHHCHTLSSTSYAKKTGVSYTQLKSARTVPNDNSLTSGYPGYNKSGELGYIFNNGSGNAIYFILDQKGPGGYYITNITY